MSHIDTTVAGYNLLVVHDHELFIDVYHYDSMSRHQMLMLPNTTVRQERNQSCLLIKLFKTNYVQYVSCCVLFHVIFMMLLRVMSPKFL